MNNKEIFEKMLNTNVKGFIEKKNNLNYLSWCQAWEQFKLNYPDAKYRIIRFENNLPYIYDEKTGYMVFTEVTANDLTYEMWLPVMDTNNQAMKAEPYKYRTKYEEKTVNAATMFDINKTIMRCLTKNLAMFGLGLSIYQGEDLPDTDVNTTPLEQPAPKPAVKPAPATVKKPVEKPTAAKPKVLPAIDPTSKITFGKYNGKTWAEVFAEDKSYFDYVISHQDNPDQAKRLKNLYDKLSADEKAAMQTAADFKTIDTDFVGDFEEALIQERTAQ